MKNIPKLKAILMYHVIAGKHTVDEISQMKSAKTIQGQQFIIDAHKWHLHINPKINDANIKYKNIPADNGIIQVLDKVLMPNMEQTCPVCGMGFITMEGLNAHTKTAHVAEKMSEPIPVIEQVPEAMPSQEIHMRGVEPNQIQCPFCGKTFRNNSDMERHIDSMHHETKGHE